MNSMRDAAASASLSGPFAASANRKPPARRRRRPPFCLRLTPEERARLEHDAGNPEA